MTVVLFSVFHHFFLSFISFLISVSGCSRCVTCGLLSNFISFCVGMCTYAYLHVKKVLYFVCVPSNHLLKLQMCFSYTSDLIENSVLSLPSPDLLILSIPCTVRPLLPLLLSPPLLLYWPLLLPWFCIWSKYFFSERRKAIYIFIYTQVNMIFSFPKTFIILIITWPSEKDPCKCWG